LVVRHFDIRQNRLRNRVVLEFNDSGGIARGTASTALTAHYVSSSRGALELSSPTAIE
jgi:hypothetical protein